MVLLYCLVLLLRALHGDASRQQGQNALLDRSPVPPHSHTRTSTPTHPHSPLQVLEHNYRLKMMYSPDYKGVDTEQALAVSNWGWGDGQAVLLCWLCWLTDRQAGWVGFPRWPPNSQLLRSPLPPPLLLARLAHPPACLLCLLCCACCAVLCRTSAPASASTRRVTRPSWTAPCTTSSSSTWSQVGGGADGWELGGAGGALGVLGVLTAGVRGGRVGATLACHMVTGGRVGGC